MRVGGNKTASVQIHRRMGTSSSSTMDVTCLKPSEYRGDPNTAVAGRIVILKKGKRNQRWQGKCPDAEAGSASGRNRKLDRSAIRGSLGRDRRPACAEVRRGRCRGYSSRVLSGDSSAVFHFTPPLPPAAERTSGPASRVQKVPQAPWEGLPAVHPLVPLQALSRVKDRQQICVAVSVVENPGAIERQTKDGPAMVCNAIVQHAALPLLFLA